MGEMTRSRFVMFGAAVAVAGAPATFANNILSPGDFIIAIDNNRNLPGIFNPPPSTEFPAQVLDQNSATKYLNFGRELTGIIVTPAVGTSVLQSFRLTTANDSSNRDPAAYRLYGTNAPITSTDNSNGLAESWNLIQAGTLNLTTNRVTVQTPVDITNSTNYNSYKLLFSQLRKANDAGAASNPNSMQVADVQFFSAPAAGGTPLLAVGDPIVGVDETDSAYPPTERPLEAIDGLKTSGSKYLNFGREGTGLIITPVAGSTIVKSLRLTTGNDTPSRDPASYELYGTNSLIGSYEHSDGNGEAWTLISSGAYTLPGDPLINLDQRNVEGPIVEFTNNTAYTSYKVIFPDNKGPDTGTGSANSIQFSELELFVPEPGTAGLVVGGALIALARRRREG